MASELKPCLLCEGEAKLLRRSGAAGRVCPSKWYRERVECKVCGLTTREYKSPGAAKHSWNTRPTPVAPVSPQGIVISNRFYEHLIALTGYHITRPPTPDHEFVNVCNGDLRKLSDFMDTVAPVSPDATGKCDPAPAIGSIWSHYNGIKYKVVFVTNVGAEDAARYPETVVYQNVTNFKLYSRPLSDWHRSLTLSEQQVVDTGTCRELETVRIEKRLVSPYPQFWVSSYLPPDQPFDKFWTDPENGKQYEHRALVTRSQAEKLLAEKDERLKEWQNKWAQTDILQLKTEADNAALTARVKELEADLMCAKASRDSWKRTHEESFHRLEAKLAAAEKALETKSAANEALSKSVVESIDTEKQLREALEAIAALNATDMSFGDQVFAVTSARAALGGKPS